MNRILRLAVLPLALAAFTPPPAGAQGYPIDCAIFLCLAGGFPASPECSAAEAVFIARIESFQPPLQLWNCPMGATFRRDEMEHPLVTLARLNETGESKLLQGPFKPMETPAAPLPAAVDFTGADYGFLRSIHVWWTRGIVSRHHDDCTNTELISEGWYDAGNNWHWADGLHTPPVPAYLPRFASSYDCGVGWNDVGADWTDYYGNPSHILKPLFGH